MNDNPSPFELHTDEHLEARITAYILGESSAFEAAEIEDLISKSPELKLFANRTRALNELLREAETTSNSPDAEWKLSGERRIALAPILGSVPVLMPEARKENRIRRASFRAAFGIAAVFLITLFISPMFIRQRKKADSGKLSGLSVSLPMAMEEAEPKPGARMSRALANKAESNPSEPAPDEAASQIAAAQVRNSGPVDFKEGMTLGEAVKGAGGATEFGSTKRVRVYPNGKTQTYDLTDERLAQIELQPNDTIEVPQKNWFGCGASRDELAEVERAPEPPASAMSKAIAANTANPVAIPVPDVNAPTPSPDFGDGSDFGGGWGEGSGGGGGFAAKGNDESFAMKGRDSAPGDAAYDGPVAGTTVPGIPAEEAPSGSGIVANGLSSGDSAVSRNSIDAILNNPDRTAHERKKIEELQAQRKELEESSAELRSLALNDLAEPMNRAEKTGTGALGLESKKALSDSDGIPTIETRSMSDLAQREVLRRQNSVAEADEQMKGGRDAYEKGDFSKAREQFDDALANLPDSPALEDRRKAITDQLGKASVADAQEKRKIGKYGEAREILEKSAAAGGENQEEIKSELAHLDDPIRTSPALSFEHAKQIDEVRRKLYMAEGNFDLGKYDHAKKAYEDALRADPYNNAARRGMEKVEAAKSDYYRAAYDHTRAELLMQVDKAWELDVPGAPPAEGKDQRPDSDALAQDGKKSADAWKSGQLAGDKLPSDMGGNTAGTRYEMDVRAGAERQAGSEQSGFAWWLGSANQKADAFNANSTSTWGGLKSDLSQLQEADSPDMGNLFSRKAEIDDEMHSGNASDYLFRGTDLSGNVTGFTGAWNSIPATPATPSNFKTANSGITLEAVPSIPEFDGFVNYGTPIAGEPKQVKIKTKFTEIAQANNEELGFDWVLSPFGPLEGNAKTNDKVIRREVPLMPNFFLTDNDASVITKSGAAANPEVIREFIYPTEYEAPEADEVPLLGDIPVTGRLLEEKPVNLADLSNEIPATQEPFSTFSLNISDASFQVASSAVAKGERPDPESIKPEQFYNAVPYDDPAPSTGEPVAAAIGQLAHPVIPGRNLVRMSVRTASTGRAATQPLVLTLLIDQSGSMARGDRRAAMDKALTQLATLMQPDDRITVIGFSRTANLLADSLPGDEAAKLPDIINQASSEGGTNLEQAINLAESLALRHKLDGAQNRIVLFTDGAANLGNADPERLAGRVKTIRRQDLAFDIAGIGTDDINDHLLSELARHGNGRYYLVGESTGESLAKQLAGAFRPAAENVKIQVKFNPQRVGNYKLIGFEKDRLKTEDFRNDAVDAAELAADESGTALYQVEPLADGSGELGELFVRFRDTATGEMVERSWTIPYEPQAPAIDKAQPPMQLAALSLLAAQKLQTGPLADAINFRDLAPTIAAVKQAYSQSPEAQQMITLINALK